LTFALRLVIHLVRLYIGQSIYIAVQESVTKKVASDLFISSLRTSQPASRWFLYKQSANTRSEKIWEALAGVCWGVLQTYRAGRARLADKWRDNVYPMRQAFLYSGERPVRPLGGPCVRQVPHSTTARRHYCSNLPHNMPLTTSPISTSFHLPRSFSPCRPKGWVL